MKRRTIALLAAAIAGSGATRLAPNVRQARRLLRVAAAPPAAAESTEAAAARDAAAAPDQFVERVLGRLTIEQKIGQLMMVAFSGPHPTADVIEMLERYHAGGIILFQDNTGSGGPASVRALTDELQRHAVLGTGDGNGLPLLIAVDQEGGPVNRVLEGVTLFPGNMALGAAGSAALTARAYATTAAELRAMGINVNLGPVVDVNSNLLNPVIGTRSFGGEPALVARLATAAIRASQEAGVLAIAKHYPGHGDASVDSHLALPLLAHSLSHFETIEWPPFRAAVDAGVAGVMTAHLAVPALEPDPQLPASLSPNVVGRLRDLVGDERLIISDDLEMGAITDRFGTAEAARLAFLAGSDILLFRRNAAEQRQAFWLLVDAVSSGTISPDRLDASVRRILRAKQALGLLGSLSPAAAVDQLDQVGSPEHQAVAGEVARRAVTLVRNDGAVLPLHLSAAEGQRLCVIFPRTDELARWEVLPPAHDSLPTLGSALASRYPLVDAIEVGLRPSEADRRAAVDCARGAAAVVVGTYDVQAFPEQALLVGALRATGVPVLVAALRLPYDLQYLPPVPAFLAAYSQRPAALQAVAAAILGEIEPAGRLPVAIGDEYPAGFGLSYHGPLP